MTSERIEWVEIIEPKTKEVMYANLSTGECVWDPPEGVSIKRTDSSQWWELFDSNTQRFYYYNVASQTTVWHRPQNCDIIPLAKLQTLKQNTDDRKDGSTQTSHSKVRSSKVNSCATNKITGSPGSLDLGNRYQHSSPPVSQPVRSNSGGNQDKNSEVLSGIHIRNSYRIPSGDPSLPSGKSYCRHSQGSTTRGHKPKESGKSSDSSISSTHGYRRLNEGGSLRIANTHSKSKNLPDNNYRILQESTSSQNISHVQCPGSGDKQTLQQQQHYQLHPKLSYSISNSSDLGGVSPTRSANTPILKKKLSSESSIHGNIGVVNKREGANHIAKHQSIDYPSATIVSLTRSGSFMSSPTSHHIHQHALPAYHQRKSSIDGNGGGASDDSMHEKYFKSVENTPLSRRRHTTSSKSSNKKHSSDSSPQSPISPQNHNTKSARPSVLSSLSALEPPQPGMAYNMISSHKNHADFLNLDLAGKPEKYLDKMRLDKRSPGSCVTHSSNSPCGTIPGGTSGPDTLPKKGYIKSSPSPGSSKHIPSSSQYPSNNVVSIGHQSSLDQYLSKTNIERHNKEVKHVEKSSGKRKNRKHYNHGSSSDVEYDNGNISPLYSNWDQEMQEHLLPLQHYILEQAKLSGHYGFGDPLDSDSYHSDSQSEHSLSGHEPDNEDSDHSDGHGDYLTHSYGLIDDYVSNIGDGVSYYAYQYGFDKSDREDISSNVEAVLEGERENTQIYNNVPRNHHFHVSPPSPRQLSQHQQQQQQLNLQQQQYQKNMQQSVSPSQMRHFSKIPEIREPKKSDDLLHKKQNQEIKEKNQPISILKKFEIGYKSSLPFHIPPPASTSNSNSAGGGGQLSCMKECDIEKFAQDNLNLHSKGIFRKKSSIRDMLSWTADAISRPMLTLARDKAGKKMATELFKLVQIYMGDRKARAGMSLNSVAIDIIITALGQQQLRDEMYVQLCRQTTENPKRESLIRGWELMAICLSFVPPSPTFQPALLNYVNRHRDPTFATTFPEVGKWPIHVQISHYATVCCRRLDRIGSSGRKQAKKPTEDEVEQARTQILRDSMFGNTIEEVMQLQKDKFPDRRLPWIQTTLSEQVLLLSGKQTEGIFRVSADVDEVNCLKSRLDRWEVPEHKNTMDAHAPASLLKLWYRELYDPLIPDELYNECVQTEDPDEANRIINKLPALSKLVLTYLINFLQQFVQPDVVNCTKMDSSNLAMVFAPNCLRCMSDDPKVILENARKEMAFMRTLIQHMDTSSVNNLV